MTAHSTMALSEENDRLAPLMGLVQLGRLLLDALDEGGLRGALAGLAVVTLTLVSIPLGGILVTALGTRLLTLVGGAVAVGVGWVLIRRARSKARVAARIVVTLMCVWATGQLALSVSANAPADGPIGVLVIPIATLALVGLLRTAFQHEPARPASEEETDSPERAP